MSNAIYHYSPITGDFLGSDVARESPLEPGVFFVPANATTDAPPNCGEGERPVFKDGGWSVEPIPEPVSPPQPTLEEVKAGIWEQINIKRDWLTQNGGYPLDSYWFHSDAYSLSQQQGLILAAMQVQAAGGDLDALLIPTPWQTMGGAQAPMTARLALRLLAAAMAQQGAIFEAAKAHKAALEVSADPASYNYSSGWPQVFGE